jgi:AraC-like DNA-binding protein
VQIIPLVRAKYVYAYAAVLDRLGAPRWRLLERVGLSDRVLEDPEAIIPARQAWAFIESAALREGIDDLGLVASDMSIQDYGEFSDRLLLVPNLNQALKAFCQLSLHEYSRADFYVAQSERSTWFCRGPIEGNDTEKKHVELHVLTMMIATVRLAAGPDWHPPIVLLQTKNASRVQQHHLLAHSTVRFDNRITAFEVPQHLLPKNLPTSAAFEDTREYERLEHEFPVAIRQVVEGMLLEGVPRIASVAEAVGGSVRTLQRRLSDIDTTFSDIVEEAKMKSANRMISQSDCTLAEIAHGLGYSDQAHFTRAFRRWNGVSPGVFRRLKAQATSNDE